MTSNLFLFEIFVNRIMFNGEVATPATKEDLSFSFKFSNIFNIFVEPRQYKLKHGLRSQDTETILWYNMGVSHMFVNSPQYLNVQLKKAPIDCTLYYRNKCMGKSKTPWKQDFIEMVSLLERVGVVKAVDNTDFISIQDPEEKKVATLVVFFRLTCPGDCIESEILTDVDVTLNRHQHVSIFIYLKTSKKALCRGYDYMSTDFVPVTMLYKPVLWIMPADFYPGAGNIFPAPLTVAQDDTANMIELFDQVSFDTISIALNPDTEQKFYDFLNVTVTGEKGWSASRDDFETVYVETLDSVATKICRKNDCPGCRKFDQLGIDQLKLRPAVDYLEPGARSMINHANGTLEGYGPLGNYRRPKRFELPFVPLGTLNEEGTMSVTNPCCDGRKGKVTSRKRQRKVKAGSALDCARNTSS